MIPAFLRVNVKASLRASDDVEDFGEIMGGLWFVAMITLAPDKLLILAVIKQIKASDTRKRGVHGYGTAVNECGTVLVVVATSAVSAWLEVCSIAALGFHSCAWFGTRGEPER